MTFAPFALVVIGVAVVLGITVVAGTTLASLGVAMLPADFEDTIDGAKFCGLAAVLAFAAAPVGRLRLLLPRLTLLLLLLLAAAVVAVACDAAGSTGVFSG